METKYTRFSSFGEFAEKADCSTVQSLRNNLHAEMSNIGAIGGKSLREKSEFLFLREYDNQLYDLLDYLDRGEFRYRDLTEGDKAARCTMKSIVSKLVKSGQLRSPKHKPTE